MNNIKIIDYFIYYIYFYIFVTPWHFSKSQTSVLSVILLIWAIIKYRKTFLFKLKAISKFTPLFLFFVFILYTYISVFWSEPMKDGLKHINNFTKYYFLFIPAILVSMNKENAINAIKLLTISFGLYGVYSILIYFGLINIEGFNINDPKGHLRYLIVSQYMSIGFFISFFIAYNTKIKKERVLFLLISLVTFFALFVNNSRTAQLSFLFVSFILGITFFRKYMLNLKVIILLIIILCSSMYVLYENNKLTRYTIAYNEFTDMIKNDSYKGSFGLRLYFNKTGLDILSDNILFGTGPQDNRILLQKIQKNDINYKEKILNHFHSEHIDNLTAYGVVGYLLLLSSIVVLIYRLRKEAFFYSISLSIFLTLFFNSFANKTLSVKPLNYVYIILFILLVIIAYNTKRNNEQKS